MKTRLISDLHIYINAYYTELDPKNLEFGFEKEINDTDLVLIAGDIGASSKEEIYYLNKLKPLLNENTKICAVCGNHLGYDYNGAETKQSMLQKLRNKYKKDNIFYLEKDFVDFGDYIVVGSCLYTDFSLYNTQERSKNIAERNINDFRYVRYMDFIEGYNRYYTADDYIKLHNSAREYIDAICKRFINKKIIVLTHFLPTPDLISDVYVDNYLNPYYCTDLTELIKENSNIVFWGAGHSHESKSCTINNTKLAIAPMGYYIHDERAVHPKEYRGLVLDV